MNYNLMFEMELRTAIYWKFPNIKDLEVVIEEGNLSTISFTSGATAEEMNLFMKELKEYKPNFNKLTTTTPTSNAK